MTGQDEPRDLAALVVPQAGWLERTEDPWEPYRLLDQAGTLVGPVAAFLRGLQACGRPATTLPAYAIPLLPWFRPCGRPAGLTTRCPGPRPGTMTVASDSPSSTGAQAAP